MNLLIDEYLLWKIENNKNGIVLNTDNDVIIDYKIL